MNTLLKSSLALSAALMLGRVLGFLREVLLAGRVGVSAEADIAVMVMTLPDFLVGLLLTGGFSAALVPALRRSEGDARSDLFRYTATLSLTVTGLIAMLVALFPQVLFQVLAPALPDSVIAPHLSAIRLIALSLPLAGLAGVIGAYLNARGTFFVVGLGTVIYNLVLCATLGFLPAGNALIPALAIGVVVAALLRVIALAISARPPLKPLLTRPQSAEAGLSTLFISGVLAVGITLFAHVTLRSIASLSAGEGGLAAFSYALKLFDLPVMILFAPIATVLLPRFTDAPQDKALMSRGAAALLVLALATTATGLSVGDAIARLIFMRGNMTEAGLAGIVWNARLMFIAIPFVALSMLGTTWLNANRQTRRVLLNAAIALSLGVGIALVNADLVLVGFVVFHAVNAVLNLSATPLDMRHVIEILTPMRLTLVVALISAAFALDLLLLSNGPPIYCVMLGAGLWIAILALWADRLQALREKH